MNRLQNMNGQDWIETTSTNYNPGNLSNTALKNYLYATRLELCQIYFHKFSLKQNELP